MSDPGPCDYVSLPQFSPKWLVLDLGPGRYPLPRANVYLDRDWKFLAPLQADGKEVLTGNLADGLPHIPDKCFDFVWCSHVLEHMEDPLDSAATLSRIAKRGMMVVPSAIKESLFLFEEPEHKWWILRDPKDGPPIFIRHHPSIAKLKDRQMQGLLCELFRSGRNAAGLEWYREHEVDLDIAIPWEGELKLHVIG